MKLKLKLKLTLTIALIANLIIAQTGPGGIGKTDGTTSLKIWYNTSNTSNISVTSGLINSITNSAGVAALDISEIGTQRPTLVTGVVNGYNEMSFSGTNRLRTGLNLTTSNFITDQASSFVVAKADNTSQTTSVYLTDSLVGATRFSCHIPWNGTVYYDIGTCCSTNARIQVGGLTNLTSYSYWSYDANPITGKQLYRNGTLLQNRTNTTLYNSHATQRFNIGANTSGSAGFAGDVTEIIIFREKINSTQRIIIENYLSAKFDITSANNDFYTQDDSGNGNYDHHVAGIGQETATDNHTDSQGTGIIRINTPSTLADNDYLFWGEETKNATYDFIITADYLERLNSKWRISKLNNLGTVTLSVNESDLNLSGKQTCANLKLIVSNNVNFATKTVYDMTLTSGVYETTLVNFTNGDYFTLEYQDKIVVDGTQYYNGSGFMNVPNTFDSCYKFLVKSTANGLLPMTQGANVREVEVETNGVLAINNGLRLTVENGIQLDGDIRLFGSSQLIQNHTGTSQVTGNGKLYLDRKSDLSNVFQSGYWSSPVTVSGNIFTVGGVMKDGTIPTNATTTPPNITFVSTYDGATTTPITLSRFWLAKLINDLDWDRHRDETTTHNPTEGFNMKSTGLTSGQNFTFVGKPNDGDYLSTITTGNSSLLGNPYPSALDGDVFILDNSGLFTTLYFWDGINDTSNSHNINSYLGGYATRVIGMGTPFNSGTTPNRYISVGQGFFVDAISTGTINFKNSQRAFTSGSTYKSTASFPILRFGFEFNIENNKVYHRQLAIGFRGLTNNYDNAYDAVMYDMKASDIALKVNNNENYFVITGIEDFSDTIEIPLHVRLDKQRNVTFKIDGLENLETQNIFLKDAFTNQFYNLINDVNLNLPIGNYTDRFFITFKNSTLSINNLTNDANIIIVDNINNLTINVLNSVEIKKTTVFNILGQILLSKNVNSTNVNLPLQIEKGQVILVKVELINGQIITKKLIKK